MMNDELVTTVMSESSGDKNQKRTDAHG